MIQHDCGHGAFSRPCIIGYGSSPSRCGPAAIAERSIARPYAQIGDHCCRMGADCRELRALGLKGNCMPLPERRPTNKAVSTAAEPVERRAEAKGKLPDQEGEI